MHRIFASVLMLTFFVLLPSVPLFAMSAGTVVEVVSGDMIKVDIRGQIKAIYLKDIDCPELEQPYGKQALEFTKKTVLNQQVAISAKKKNTMGQTFASVLVNNGKKLELLLAKEGLAWAKKSTKNTMVKNAVTAARNKQRGLWKQPSPVSPWTYRAQHENSQQQVADLLWRAASKGPKSTEIKVMDFKWGHSTIGGGLPSTIWEVAVQNTSDKAISTAQAEIEIYDNRGQLIKTDRIMFHDLQPGSTKRNKHYLDYLKKAGKARVRAYAGT